MSKATKQTNSTTNQKHRTKAAAQTKPAKQRNTLLTIALVLVILHGILVVALFWAGAPETQRTVGSIALWLTILAAVGDVVAAVGMWFWKQLGHLPVRNCDDCRRRRCAARYWEHAVPLWFPAAGHHRAVYRRHAAR